MGEACVEQVQALDYDLSKNRVSLFIENAEFGCYCICFIGYRLGIWAAYSQVSVLPILAVW